MERKQEQEATPVPEIKLTRADLAEILAKRRTATLEELEWLFAHAKDQQVQLTDTEQYELRILASRLQSDRRRGQANREQSEKFVVEVLRVYKTPFGDLNDSDVTQLESIRTAADRSIANCRDHKRERCSCWRDARDQLFDLRSRVGDRTPLGLAALAVWNSIEALAKDRKEPLEQIQQQLPPNLSPQAQADLTGTPQPVPFNWRYWKAPAYMEHVR